jgi:hypothetical protein
MKGILRTLSWPVTLMLVAFALWAASIYWTRRAIATEPGGGPTVSDGGPPGTAPSNEITDFPQLD